VPVRLAAVAALAALLAAPPAAPAREGRATLAVAAAASLKGAAEELARRFEAERPGVDVTVTLGASGALFAQLRNGAPFDVFLSADREYPAKLLAAKLATDERLYARGRLVAWVPPGSRLDLGTRGLVALADPAVRRIALANPAVAPFGRATERALRSAGVWDAVQEKLVLGTSVAQAAQFATTGAADVAFLPSSLALARELEGGRTVVVEDALYPHLDQSGVVIASSPVPQLGRAFLAFLTGEEGRAVLARHGHGLP
jgi:molybdate transport system substrate-binding protein